MVMLTTTAHAQFPGFYKWGLFISSVDIMCDANIKSGLAMDKIGHEVHVHQDISYYAIVQLENTTSITADVLAHLMSHPLL